MAVTTFYEGEDKFLRDVTRTLREHLRENLIALVVFGSYARGEATDASDCDVYLIANNLPLNLFDRAGYVNGYDRSLFPRVISIKADTREEFESGFPSLYLDVALDGILLFDTNDYMNQKLAHIRRVTREAGLVRVRLEGGFMWEWIKSPKPRWELDWEGFREIA